MVSTKWKWYPHKRRHSRWKLSQELKGKQATFWYSLQSTRVEIASHKIQIVKPRIWSWQVGCHLSVHRISYSSNQGGSLEHITLIAIMFCFNEFAFTVLHTHTRLTALCPGLPRWAGTRKVRPIRILLKQEMVSGSGISWAICKSASHSREITMPAPHHSVFLQVGCPSCCPTNSIKALKVLVKHKINSTQILGFILICLYFTTGHLQLAQFSATESSSMGIAL